MIFSTGLYHAIKIEIGNDKINPTANPLTTENKLEPISFQNTPRDNIVPNDSKTTNMFGKLREVVGLIDNNHQTISAVIKERPNQAAFGISNFEFFVFFLTVEVF